jgi:sterol 3beta-glucosyltransferase
MSAISIVASGSRGDVQPYVALGVGLKAAGYDVSLLTNDNFCSLATDAGLASHSIGPSVEETVQTDEWRETMGRGNVLLILRKMQAEIGRIAAQQAERVPNLLRGSDLLIAGMAGMGGPFAAAEHFGIPILQAYTIPFAPTAAFPGPLTPNLRLGGAVNRMSFRVTRQMFWQSIRAADRVMRRVLGMRGGAILGPFGQMERQRVPALYGYSRHVLPQPTDWADHHQVTGYWFLDEPTDWSPPPQLLDFIEAASPPVYVGFGSMSSRNPEKVGRIVLQALERSGRRGVLAVGWGGLRATDYPDTVFPVSSLPHSWLFPRMAAVVHHGGVGTTAAGLRAGVPSIIVPFSLDQPFWGRRVAELGVGPSPVPQKTLTEERLANAITRAVSDQAMRQSAAALGRSIRAEDGVEAAVACVDRLLR